MKIMPGVMVVLRSGRTVVALEELHNVETLPESEIPGWGVVCGFEALDGDVRVFVERSDVVNFWTPEPGEHD